MAIQVGQKVGDYEVIDLLESSRKDVVFKVRNALTQRFEALRVLPKTLQDDPEGETRFLREAKVHARISHPNIVSFYNASRLAGHLVMTTELVEGRTLAECLEAGPLPVETALAYASQVLSALAHAHALGVVHRDITPSNIILTPDGNLKLTGFSLAKATTDPQLTQPGTVVGSLHYISPEQIKGLSELDARTDIYSLGVVLYEAVTGRKPFDQKSHFEIMMAHVNSLPPAPSIVNPEVPAELSEIILTAMAKNPAARFQTANEFRERVDRLRGVPGAKPETPVTVAVPAREPVEPEEDSKWSFAGLVAAGLFTFVLVILMFFAVVGRS